MNNNNRFKFNNLNLVCILSLIGLFKLIKFSFLVGSVRAFFSLTNVSGPLTVVFGGFLGGLLGLFLNYAFQAKSASLLAVFLSGSGIPNLLAGLYWRAHSNWVKIGVPSLCMLLFWYQTWGTIAMTYALIWLIPILISYFKIEHLYFKSLAATLIAHSVGSVIWVYGANLSHEQWFALIPLALSERLFLAILMGATYSLVRYVSASCAFINVKMNKWTESTLV